MTALRLKHMLKPLVTTRTWSPWVVAPKYAHELRVLKRRVAAARLGEAVPQRYSRQWRYEDLR